MGTAEKLLTINETDFETLVVLYLRQRSPDLQGLIHTGMNEDGKSIKCPVDAVLHIIGPPSKLVHVAATVHKQTEIQRKWLGGKKTKGKPEPGDIAKAHEEFAAWSTEPETKRKLYLGWNRTLENDTQLYRDVKARCQSLDMEVEVIEASQLVDFLDHDPEGQYLRQEFLGIDALRLSQSLLRKIAISSLRYHSQTFGPSDSEEQVEIHRDAGDDLRRALGRGASALIGVVAPSGAGKSTLARQCGVKLNSEDAICLWVPAEDIKPHISPGTLLLSVLRRFYPALNERAGDDALLIASTASTGLVLLVDDVNRTRSPSEALEAIRSCSRFDFEGQGGRDQPRIRFVVPMWPSRLTEQQPDNLLKWEIIELDYYSRAERQRLANARSDTQQGDVLSILDSLGGDPFLCDLALSSLARETLSPTASRASIIKSIIEDVVARATLEAAKSQTEATQDEFALALDRLIEHMLIADEPEPPWEGVRLNLGDRASTLLLQLGKTNRIGWVEQRLDGSYWRWKHDRLRDAIVGRWLAKSVIPVLEVGANNAEAIKLSKIPGAAEAWAWALAFSHSASHCQLIDMLAEHQPLALAAALALIEFEKEDDAASRLIKALQESLEGYSSSAERFVETPLWPVLDRITRMTNPLVLRITEKLERNWHVNFGRFRNGETHAGLRLMERFFSPMGMNFPQLDRATEEYARFNENRRTQVATDLLEELHDPTSLIPVLALCGYLRWEELSDLAWNAWTAVDADQQQNALIPLIWALCRCSPLRDQDRLEDALLRARLWTNKDQDDEDGDNGHERYDKFTEPLHFMLRGEITEAASKTLARVATDYDDLTSDMLYVLRDIDTPATVEAYVRLTGRSGGLWWDQIEATDRHDAGSHQREHGPVNPASRDSLWRIIQSDEPENTRKVAFWLWKRFPLSEDLAKLRSIAENDALFDDVLKVRLLMKDRSAAPLLLLRLRAKPGAWSPYAYTVYYEPGVAEALFDKLEAALGSDIIERQYVERIPQNLPREGIRRLLNEKKDLLRNSPKVWNSLWRSDVPEALEFVRQILSEADPKDLERFSFGSGNSYPVSQAMLDAITPVLSRFSDHGFHWLTTLIIHAGRADWLESVGVRRKTRSFKGSIRWWLNEDDALKVFELTARSVRHGPQKAKRTPNYYDIERESNKLSFDPRKVLREWIKNPKEPDHIIVAGMLLARIGTGNDAEWWSQLEPGVANYAHETWDDTLYILRRRRWQKHD